MGNNADRDVGWGIVGSRQTRTRRGEISEVPTSKTKTLASKFVSYLYESMRWKRRALNDLLQLTKRCGRSQHAELMFARSFSPGVQ